MRKIALFLLLASTVTAVLFPQNVSAASQCAGVRSGVGSGVTIPNGASSHSIVMDMSGYSSTQSYQFFSQTPNKRAPVSPAFKPGENASLSNGDGTLKVENGIVTWTINSEKGLAANGQNIKVSFYKAGPLFLITDLVCDVGSYKTAEFSQPPANTTCKLYVSQQRGGQTCYQSGCLYAGGVDTTVTVENVRNSDGSLYNGVLYFDIAGRGIAAPGNMSTFISNGSASVIFPAKHATTYSVTVHRAGVSSSGTPRPGEEVCPTFNFQTSTDGSCQSLCGEKINAYEGQQIVPNFELCTQTDPGSEAHDKCIACIEGTTLGGKQGIWTAIGCISTEPTGIIQTLIRLALGLGGGITLLLILAGAFRLSVSQGDPKAADEAKEQITSAVIGLLFIIFSVVMLRFIGVQVLQIPGFGG